MLPARAVPFRPEVTEHSMECSGMRVFLGDKGVERIAELRIGDMRPCGLQQRNNEPLFEENDLLQPVKAVKLIVAKPLGFTEISPCPRERKRGEALRRKPQAPGARITKTHVWRRSMECLF